MRLIAALTASLILSACASTAPEPGAGSSAAVIQGVVRTADGSAIPAGAAVKVRLEEQGIMDAPAARIGETEARGEGKAEVGFFLTPDVPALRAASRPGWSVRIEQDGRLIYVNDTSHPYAPGAATITVVPVK